MVTLSVHPFILSLERVCCSEAQRRAHQGDHVELKSRLLSRYLLDGSHANDLDMIDRRGSKDPSESGIKVESKLAATADDFSHASCEPRPRAPKTFGERNLAVDASLKPFEGSWTTSTLQSEASIDSKTEDERIRGEHEEVTYQMSVGALDNSDRQVSPLYVCRVKESFHSAIRTSDGS